MSNIRKVKKRPYGDKINKFIGEFPDLFYDGVKIICKTCNISLMCWDKRDCRVHVNSVQHQDKKSGLPLKTDFMFDLLLTLVDCDVPLHILDKQVFREFWNKYNPQVDLPSRSTLRRYLPTVREDIVNRIKSALNNRCLWLCVDETIDCKKNSILNVIARVLDPFKPTFSLLLASKRLTDRTAKTITKVVVETLKKFEVSTSQVLIFVTDGAATMRLVSRSLKTDGCRFLHITCKVHALHLVVETIRKCFPEVDALIQSTKKVFFNCPERLRAFRRQCPNIPEPPQPILTRWGTWLKAAFYYYEYFQQIKVMILQFSPDEAVAIKESQTGFQDVSLETNLKSIYNNYKGIYDAIEKLQNTALSLVESLQIVDDVNTELHVRNDVENNCIREKFEKVLRADPDFSELKQICEGSVTHPLSGFREYFNHASITSIDVEQSFSKYNHLFSPQRTSLSETTVETYLMIYSLQISNL